MSRHVPEAAIAIVAGPATGGAEVAARRNARVAAPADPARRLVDGPIASTLLRLAAPTVVVLMVQTLVGVAEIYFVSGLGTAALAGVTLVFPVLMLIQMMANGGIGGRVAAAIARALGAGRREDAAALAWHALVLGMGFGLVFTLGALLGGPYLYRVLGGEGAALGAALAYSQIVFAASVPMWITALLAAALRGAGNVKFPAAVTFAGALVLVPLSPALIFGLGPLPPLGVAGAGLAVAFYYVAAAIALIAYLRSHHGGLRFAAVRLERRLFAEIMGVGGLSAIGTVQANLTVALVTGAVGLYGTSAIAGYGIGSRLDYLLIPLLFGLGTTAVTMVGTAVGRGLAARARRIAWTAAAIGGGGAGFIGVVVAIVPSLWTSLFTSDPAVAGLAATYLRIVAPFYVLFGAGYMLYFSSQGAKRVLLPVLAGTGRLLIAGGAGWFAAATLGVGLSGLFTLVAAASAAFAIVCVLAVRARAWGTQ